MSRCSIRDSDWSEIGILIVILLISLFGMSMCGSASFESRLEGHEYLVVNGETYLISEIDGVEYLPRYRANDIIVVYMHDGTEVRFQEGSYTIK